MPLYNTSNKYLTDLGPKSINTSDAHGEMHVIASDRCSFTTKQSNLLRPAAAQPLLTPRDAANWLGVSLTTIYRLIDRRDLPAIRVSRTLRIAPEDIDAYVAARRTGTS